MNILITGGNGKIGGIINGLLQDTPFKIDNFDLKNGDDLFKLDLLKRRLENVSTVIHLAAIPHPFHFGKSELDYWKLNLEGTQVVFNASKEAGVSRFIFASSGCVYGFWGGMAQPEQFPIREDNYLPTIKEGQTIYGATKIAAEKFLQSESSRALKSIALRLESPGKNQIITEESLITENYLNAGGLQEIGTLHRFHFWACISRLNLRNVILNSISNDFDFDFETFNVNNSNVSSEVDHISWLKKKYPNIPVNIKNDQALISIEKSINLLNYNPILI